MSSPPPPRPAPVGRTLALLRPATGRLALATVLGAGAVAAGVGLMGTSAWLIARASERPTETVLTVAIVAVQVCGLSRGLFRYGERLVGHDAAFRLLADLRVRLYGALEPQAPAGLVDFRRGDLLARMVDDVESLQDLVLRVVPPFVVAAVVGSATVAVVWWLLPGAGAVLAASLAVAATVVPWLTARLARRSEAAQAAWRGLLTTTVLDLAEGSAELTVYGVADLQVAKVAAADAALTRSAAASAWTAGVGLGLTTLCAGVATWGGLVLGVPAAHAGRLNPVLLAVIALVPLAAFELVAPLPVSTQVLQRSRRAAARLFEIVQAPPPVADPRPAPAKGGPAVASGDPSHDGGSRQRHDLVLRGVVARHRGASAPALRGVDLELPAGRRVALVGPSGAGKSTLAEVLLRFVPYEAGSVTLDGTELADQAGDDVRRVIGLVTQDAYLFDTTLAENLRIGRRSADDAALEEVLGRVGLGEWLAQLPGGLGTAVGTGGGRVSGGQRQRIALARALLADFPVLVLDEPAEHLEPAVADRLTADLLAVTSDRSTLLITHRMVGLEAVDEVMVLEQGAVLERGNHDQLLAAGGWYAERCQEEAASDRKAEA